MVIKFDLTNKDLSILQAALQEYPKRKDITQCLLSIIEVQVEKQSDKE